MSRKFTSTVALHANLQPTYPTTGRLKGLAELRRIETALPQKCGLTSDCPDRCQKTEAGVIAGVKIRRRRHVIDWPVD